MAAAPVTTLEAFSLDALALVFEHVAVGASGKITVVSLMATYRVLEGICRAFAAALPHMKTPFDGAITAAPSRGSAFRMRCKGGQYYEELPGEEDALVLSLGETSDPFGILVVRDANQGNKLKTLLTERLDDLESANSTHPDGALFAAECLDAHRLMRLLTCEDAEFRMVQSQYVWSSALDLSELLNRSGKMHKHQTGQKCIAYREKAFNVQAARVPLITQSSLMVADAIFTPALRYTWFPDGTRVPQPTGCVSLIPNVHAEDADEKAAHFDIHLLVSFGTHESKDLMRKAGVYLLDDVKFEDKIPMYTTKSVKRHSDWYIERMEQARALKERERRNRSIVTVGGRPDEREAARRATVAASLQAEAESVLDARGRRPNYELTMSMVREEELTGMKNADFCHSDDSHSDSGGSEDSDTDYLPAPRKKKRTTPPKAPRVRPVSAPPSLRTPPAAASSLADPIMSPPPSSPPLLEEASLTPRTNSQLMAAHWLAMMTAADSDSE